MQNNANAGFTLIELLVVIGIIAVLAGIVLIAINPARQFAQARNAQRWSDINAILNAVGQYIADNKGTIPAAITGTEQEIRKTGGADLCDTLADEYVPALPTDPQSTHAGAGIAEASCGGDYDTDYTVVNNAGRITVRAPAGENGDTISVTR